MPAGLAQAEARVYALTGQLVREQLTTHAALVLTVSGLPAGLYQVRLLGAGYAEAYRVARQ